MPNTLARVNYRPTAIRFASIATLFLAIGCNKPTSSDHKATRSAEVPQPTNTAMTPASVTYAPVPSAISATPPTMESTPPTPAVQLKIEGRPEVVRVAGQGADGTAKANITVTLNSPIPIRAATASVEICTNRCWPQPDANFTAGGTQLTIPGVFLQHSVRGSEYVKVTFLDRDGKIVGTLTFTDVLLPQSRMEEMTPPSAPAPLTV